MTDILRSRYIHISMNKNILIYGPYFTNYSYAKVNRGVAFGINNSDNGYRAYLGCDKESIDYYPSDSELDKRGDIKDIVIKDFSNCDIVIYNNFPKSITSSNNLKQLPGKLKLMYVAWEESIYPKEWVDEINENLAGVLTISEFVKEILVKSGVKVPIFNTAIGLDEGLIDLHLKEYPLKTKKRVKFFHNSTAKQRKGVDLILKAYFESFKDSDDCVLVIKTKEGPDNNINEIINTLKKKNSPEVEIITEDLSEESIANLTHTIDIAVYPSRAEGFGLPALEAMYFKKPLIVTNYSGFKEFVNEENSYLLDYTLEYAKSSEFANLGSLWAEPNINTLKTLMMKLYKAVNDKKDGKVTKDVEELEDKIKKAYETSKEFRWSSTASKALSVVSSVEALSEFKDKNLAVLSFFNDETGIADYTEDLYKSVEKSFKSFYYISNNDIADRSQRDNDNVLRLWKTGETEFKDVLNFVKENNINMFHIQYHSGSMFSPSSLDNLILKLKKLDIKIYLTLHAVRGPSFDFIKELKTLDKCDKVFIHNRLDYEYAKSKLNNLVLFELPTVVFKKRDVNSLKTQLGFNNYSPIIAVHGLLNKNKNIPNVIKAINVLKERYKDIHLLALSAVSSNNIFSQGIYDECIDIIKKNNLSNHVTFIKQFLNDDQIEILLSLSDYIIFNYSEVGESSSASVRKALASGSTTIVTDINMFQEFDDEVFKIKDESVDSIVNGINTLENDDKLRGNILEASKKFSESNSYEIKVLEMLSEYSSN